jgi:hypothetical protein
MSAAASRARATIPCGQPVSSVIRWSHAVSAPGRASRADCTCTIAANGTDPASARTSSGPYRGASSVCMSRSRGCSKPGTR